ncbi:hypothetical protein CRM22_002749 [Opisthorchis felineus]|uniref:Small monomeric GTPase n=1 Tax=Opisthorchis felineus TaxID=147828 RepID=A0A4V3SG77_OPIFE|nr:hypothetical protein CRM22_002749 [Opisthorchis felineus]
MTHSANESGGRAFYPQYPPQLSRAQQWKQSYRSFHTTTCASQNSADDSGSPRQSQRKANQSEELRVPRFLPKQPLYNSFGDYNEQGNLPDRRVQDSLLSPERLNSNTSRPVVRASSFDGRIQVIDPQHQSNQLPHTLRQWEQTQRCHQNPSIFYQASVDFDHSGQPDTRNSRAPLAVAPSIEISQVHDLSDSSSSYEDDNKVSHPIRSSSLREEPKHTYLARGLSAESSSENKLADSKFLHYGSPKSPGGLRISVLPPVNDSASSMSSFERSTGLRPKLTRQPKSLYGEPPSVSPKHRDVDEVASPPIDEFDYFCQIANSPSGSKNTNPTPRSSAISRRPSRHPTAVRSHSTRSESPENVPNHPSARYLDSRASSGATSPSRQPVGQASYSLKNAHLKPPTARGKLRRASTDEEPYQLYQAERRPVNATLSFSSVNSCTVPTLCKTPPKSVPRIPACLNSLENPTIPLGVPITADSIFADEPGMTYYQVQVFGASGVGKSLLCQKLARLTNASSPECEYDEDESTQVSHSVTAALKGSVYTVNFMDSPGDAFEQNLEIKIQDCTDAFIVVYAIDDNASFAAARMITSTLSASFDPSQSPSVIRKGGSNQAVVPIPVLLVGNKTDLVRGRQVSSEDGRHFASLHDAKFIEVSASLNHMIAELFIQVVSLLGEAERKGRDPRLPNERRIKFPPSPGSSASSGKTGILSVRNNNPIPTVTGSSTVASAFRIQPSTKHSLSKFLKKHFVRSSDDCD